MAGEQADIWDSLTEGGQPVATEQDYEHGYATRDVRRDVNQYVAFEIGEELYGVPIRYIEEISKRFVTTPVPKTAPFVIGIGNVRGRVIPIVDLGLRLGLGPAGQARDARVLIVEHAGEHYGFTVDRVVEVIAVPDEELEEAPGGIGGTRAEFIAALARAEQRIFIILNLDTVLDARAFVPRGERGPA